MFGFQSTMMNLLELKFDKTQSNGVLICQQEFMSAMVVVVVVLKRVTIRFPLKN